jgi:hypothetical protein
VTFAVVKVLIEFTADASCAEILERSKFGMAIAAMIRIIATTISSSISEKPACLAFRRSSLLSEFLGASVIKLSVAKKRGEVFRLPHLA